MKTDKRTGLIRIIITLILLAAAFPLAARQTNSAATNHGTSAEAVQKRYDALNDTWRTNVIAFVLKSDDTQIPKTIGEMRQFTAIARSYVIFKRPGHRLALQLYYRNMENITKLQQLEKFVKDYRRDYAAYAKDFLSKYGMTLQDFENYDTFEKAYDNLLNRWRLDFENGMKAANVAKLTELRQDMKLFHIGITVFILFPGKSAPKVPQLQQKQSEMHHAIVMLKIHEDTLKQKAAQQ